MDWITLENKVRSIASYRWYRPARAESINGVRLDCVVKVEKDYWVLVEVSKSHTLSKLREDLAKFSSVRPYLLSKEIYSKCYFVCLNQPSEQLVVTGEGNNVNVLSFEQFSRELIDHDVYRQSRETRPFGSAVNPLTGNPDNSEYVPVSYAPKSADGGSIDVKTMAQRLSVGKQFVLLGQYGSGKSRCLQQVFQALCTNAQANCIFPFAIDLRRHWGAQNGNEIIRRHFEDLGLSEYADSIIRAYPQGGVLFLLDGFDEIGSQAWSDKPTHLRAVRHEAVKAVRDLITHTQSGVLITGRHHFFDSDEEMLECLGLAPETTLVYESPDEFTDEQMKQYIGSRDLSLDVPAWLPKRPLICQVIASLGREQVEVLLGDEESEIPFWHTFIRILCEREARIHHALTADGIHSILKRLARLTRCKALNEGPVRLSEINQVFTDLAGTMPVEESTAMLQRLPGMGRLSAESSDRQFVDSYILDGLRADDVIDHLRGNGGYKTGSPWRHPLGPFGQSIVAAAILTQEHKDRGIYVAKDAATGNPVLSGDVIAAIARTNFPIIDFRGLQLSFTEITTLDLSGNNISNLIISDSIIHALYLPDDSAQKLFVLRDCLVNEVFGLNASAQQLPGWMESCVAETVHRLDTLERIKQADLSGPQLMLVTIVKKTFFQPGAGRKEESLLRGLGNLAKPSDCKKILNSLITAGILETGKGNSGLVYRPVRGHTERMGRLLAELGRSEDPVWILVTGLGK